MSTKIKVVTFVFFSSLVSFACATFKLEERYSWSQMDFKFPSETMKEMALASGTYISTNAMPLSVEHWGEKLFVTVPRWRDGIPATLTYINTAITPSGSPELIPYPDMQSNTIGDCLNGLTSVYRIKADKCGRLWVLDTGTIGIINTTQILCPYALNVFDLATNTRIRRYVLRPEDINDKTFVTNTAVDIGESCEDTFAYFSDQLGHGLIAYSWEQNHSWRFNHPFFFPDPLRGNFHIAGLNYQWGEEGVFGIALSPIGSDGYRTLYFSPLASHREFYVSTKVLRDESRTVNNYYDFSYFSVERSSNSHTTARVISDDGVMLFGLNDRNAIGCWHTSLPYEPSYHGVADQDNISLVFPADVKIDENNDVWVLSDRLPVFLFAYLDYNDINYRIFTTSLHSLIEGTVCDLSDPSSNQFQLASVPLAKPIKPSTFAINAADPGVFGDFVREKRPEPQNLIIEDVPNPPSQTVPTKMMPKTTMPITFSKGRATFRPITGQSNYQTTANSVGSIRNTPKTDWWMMQSW